MASTDSQDTAEILRAGPLLLERARRSRRPRRSSSASAISSRRCWHGGWRRQRVDRPVYICGLPRAGTTITLQMLSEHPDVATHKYADFLMPYTPYVWNKVFPRIPVDAMRKPVPRIHRDRIEVTRDSAEMGEEILWEHFFPHIHDEDRVQRARRASTSNPAFERFYSEHLRKLLLCAGAAATSAKRSCASSACSTCARCFPTRASCSTCAIRSITSPR